MPEKLVIVEALGALGAQREARLASLDDLRRRAAAYAEAGDFAAAEQLAERLTSEAPADPASWYDLAEYRFRRGAQRGAREAVLQSIGLDARPARYHILYGRVSAELAHIGNADYLLACGCAESTLAEAIVAARHHGHSDTRDCCVREANLHAAAADLHAARTLLETAAEAHDCDPVLWSNLADVLEAAGVSSQRARALQLHAARQYADAIPLLRTALLNHPHDCKLYVALADSNRAAGEYASAIDVCREGLNACGDSEQLLQLWSESLFRRGETSDSRVIARRAAAVHTKNVLLRFAAELRLPIIYRSEEELEDCRSRFAEGLQRLDDEIRLDTSEQRESAASALVRWSNFYLAYQGEDDRELQSQFGCLARRIMTAALPQFSAPPQVLRSGRRVRVAYVSANFCTHASGRIMLGWLRGCDRRRVETITFHLGWLHDVVSAEFARHSDAYRHLRGATVRQVAQAIHDVAPDIVVYPDIGMAPGSVALAALRVAPVQCASWGHPVTSGVPTIAYYLSGAGMEPPGAAAHYSEKLIALPNLGIAYARPSQAGAASRREFGLPEDAILYLSSQSLYKYRPRYDRIFAEIAAQVPGALFVFVCHPSPQITDIFRERLRKAFAALGLKADDHCRFLPRQDEFAFVRLHAVCDVFLDPIGWSGANTAYEAASVGLPMVTTPGRFMRGRHVYAMLQSMGIPELIAADTSDYLRLAVRLGTDRDFRLAMRSRVLESGERLFDDWTAVRGVEQFYFEAADRKAGEAAE